MKYGNSGQIIEITIKDNCGGKTDFFRTNNSTEYKKIIRLIGQKYGYKPYHPENEVKDMKTEIEEEKAWLKKEVTW